MKLSQKIQSHSIFSNGLSALYLIAFITGISLGFFNPFISTLMAQNQVNEIMKFGLEPILQHIF